ncbi:MAG TPA: YIP1 family protein, partial [Bacillota bacterium]|nr:YIP1 family protein [Bacillota bacterium]
MKKRFFAVFALAFLMLTFIGSFTSSAKVPYTTYTYDVNGSMMESPHAYVPETTITTASIQNSLLLEGNESANIMYSSLGITLTDVKSVFVDDLEWVYISNAGSNQVLILNEKYELKYVLSEFVNDQGVPDSLAKPSGVFVTDTEVYVADCDSSRVVIFDKTGNFVDIVPAPSSDVFPEDDVYKPIAVAVDEAGRIYVVSSTTNYGVISLNRDGSFNGFIGPQAVTPNLFEYFWRIFQTPEQIAKQIQYVPTEYNNVTIDEDGFLYVTTNSIDEGSQQSAMNSRSKSDTYAPVKKLNPSGTDVMNRTGFFPPSGEVSVSNTSATGTSSPTGASSIVDVALGQNGAWSIIDQKRSRIFTYDSDGKMLYAFGDIGFQVGTMQKVVAVDYQGSNLICVDQSTSQLVVYKRTYYGDLINEALQNTLNNNYEKAVQYYISILQRNNNFDSAYVGIGKSFYRSGDYELAMKYFKYAYDTENYSDAFQEVRKAWIEKYVLIVPIAIVAICIIISKFFKYANKVNVKGQKMKEKRTLWEELLYAAHIIFHPFDGFWDLKHEKRGSIKGALTILAITIVAFLYNAVGKGYLFDPYFSGVNFILEATYVVLPVMLWVTANWCLTTLFDGEGTYKEVFVATCYSLTPLPMLLIPCTIASNFVTLAEADIVNFLIGFAYIWVAFLLFFGMMVTHDYSLGKNVLTTAGTIVGFAFIMFVAALF